MTASTASTASNAATSSGSAWANLAADFGARIVASTNQTITRTIGQTSTQARQGVSATGTTASADGSTAQAAGATTGTVLLPGQAVAAAGGADGSGTDTGTFDEALTAEAATGATTVKRAQGGATTDANTAAIGVANASTTVGQAETTSQVQASTGSTPTVASQIADLAQVASKRVGQNVQMVLQPEGLGTVTLRISAERGGLAVHLSVDNQQTREMVQASWPQLQQALDQRGLTVQSMLLDLSQGRSNGEAFQAFQQFNSQQGQQSGGQQRNRGGASGGDRRGTITSIDDTARPQSGAASSARVDYRI
jgi:flagellar hook-length control protein FliK